MKNNDLIDIEFEKELKNKMSDENYQKTQVGAAPQAVAPQPQPVAPQQPVAEPVTPVQPVQPVAPNTNQNV